ncbi:ABC transporter ATP-binding protein [Granulosicoccus antarcticus]|uniref:ABC transporter ATP-binding protein YtrB n=1 Tax=Granulosicoccus antarcticus IMCC3135 TaxID=1192854 RepID=A0A2Z2NX42_9GAMM|nr:ABC transporter ATP-binding protein [Granulosicoccus antarcticus]ASJ76002.1 ABC transporter ATP-binding protein YtrB [Granulosicoccus antarcticus IMCC3135]
MMIDLADEPSLNINHRTAGTPVLALQDVRKSFGSLTVLDGLSLAVYPGEVFGFLGRNGAGKSTAIRILMGILRCDAGHINVFGKSLHSDVVGIRQRIGYVAQEQNMYPWMTPKVLSRFVRGFYPRWDEKRYQKLMTDFELPPGRRIGTFSGGMKAKLALTLALSTRPQLLILDEPTAGMDPVARREFLDLVREQTMQDGATTFFSTHLIDEIEAVADRIGIVESGRTVYDGELDPLRNSIGTWSIAMQDYIPGSMPGEFSRQRLRVLKEGERQGRWVVSLQFSQEVLASHEILLAPGWRHDSMSLEDVFIAVVANA